MANPGPRHPNSRRAGHTAIATFAIGILITLAIGAVAYDGSHQRTESRFDESSAQIAAAIESQVRSDLDQLANVGAFVTATEPTPQQFDDYVAGARLVDHFESLTGLLVLDRVEEADLAAYIERRRVAQPDFTVVPIGEHQPGTAHYVVVHYATGRLGVELPIGLDVSALETVRLEIERRSSTGASFAGAIQREPIIQEAVRQLNETEYGELFRHFEFLLAVPVFEPGHREGDGMKASRWVAAPVGRLEDVLRRSLRRQPGDLGVQLAVQNTDPALEELGVDLASERANPAGRLEEAAFRSDFRFEVDGLAMSLTIWSSPDSDARSMQLLSFVLSVGALASGAAALALYLRTRDRQREVAFAYLAVAHERAELQRDVLASVSEAVVVVDEEGRIIVGNHAWTELLIACETAVDDTLPEDALGSSYAEVIDGISLGDPIGQVLDPVLQGDAEQAYAEVRLTVAGEDRWLAMVATPLHGTSRGAVVVHRDVTGEHRTLLDLEHKASTDPLTGLLNRIGLEQQAREVVNQTRDADAPVGALFIDLDGFKAINDTHGHAFGDQVLRAVGRRILSDVRSTDLAARLGGDEFVVLVHPLSDPSVAHDLAARLVMSLNRPFATGGVTVPMSASIGVVVLRGRLDASVATLVRRADEAMYESKQRGGATYTVAHGNR